MRSIIAALLLVLIFSSILSAQTMSGPVFGPCTIMSTHEASSVLGLPIKEGSRAETWVIANESTRTICRFRANAAEFIVLSVYRIEFVSENVARSWLTQDARLLRKERGLGDEAYSWGTPGVANVTVRKGRIVLMLEYRNVTASRGDIEVSDQQYRNLRDMARRLFERL